MGSVGQKTSKELTELTTNPEDTICRHQHTLVPEVQPTTYEADSPHPTELVALLMTIRTPDKSSLRKEGRAYLGS